LGVEDGADAWQALSLTRTTSDPEGETHQSDQRNLQTWPRAR
jgi:hypothetical protein